MTTATESPAPTPTLASRIGTLAGVIGHAHYPNGDRAALKRWAPGQTVPLAFYRLWLRHLGEELPAESQQQSWMLLAWGLALCGAHAHRVDLPLGQALAEARYADARLERLLSAPAELRPELFMALTRFLAAKDAAFNWTEAAEYLLARDTDARERSHRRIAQSFYRHLPKHADKE